MKLFPFSKKYRHQGSKKRKTAGFTILELLVAVLITTAIVIVLGDFVVDLLNTERREYGRTETQREMQMALDYMVNDLREAAYVYTNDELNGNNGKRGTINVPPLRDFLQIPANHELILAFWKPEAVPYRQDQSDLNCGGSPTTACQLLQVKRRTFTLVIYLQTVNQGTDKKTWKGISRIKRYQLRQYQDAAFDSSPADLSRTIPGFVSPLSGNITFSTWPGSLDGNGNFNKDPNFSNQAIDDQNAPVLVDFVDYPTKKRDDNLTPPVDPRTQCPTNYPAIPPTNNSNGFDNPSFVACVSNATNGSGTSSANQDVILFIRGNPTGKGGIKVAPLIAVRTQTVARGVIDKKPE